jgi:hypothetical protein
MIDASLIVDNLLSPAVVAFAVALLASLARFETRLPEQLPPILSAFLLFAIGLKGGRSLGGTDAEALVGPVLATVEAQGLAAEGFLAGLLAILEIVGIIAGLALAGRSGQRGAWRTSLGGVICEIVRGRSITLLLLGLAVGAIAGDERLVVVDPLFVGLFSGALLLFLLEMGAIAAERLREVARVGLRLVVAAIALPVVNGGIGAVIGALAGLSTGGTAVLATLAASASYIAAPAVARIALPTANPALSITAALGITFPFNLVLGIPIYLWFATLLT